MKKFCNKIYKLELSYSPDNVYKYLFLRKNKIDKKTALNFSIKKNCFTDITKTNLKIKNLKININRTLKYNYKKGWSPEQYNYDLKEYNNLNNKLKDTNNLNFKINKNIIKENNAKYNKLKNNYIKNIKKPRLYNKNKTKLLNKIRLLRLDFKKEYKKTVKSLDIVDKENILNKNAVNQNIIKKHHIVSDYYKIFENSIKNIFIEKTNTKNVLDNNVLIKYKKLNRFSKYFNSIYK